MTTNLAGLRPAPRTLVAALAVFASSAAFASPKRAAPPAQTTHAKSSSSTEIELDAVDATRAKPVAKKAAQAARRGSAVATTPTRRDSAAGHAVPARTADAYDVETFDDVDDATANVVRGTGVDADDTESTAARSGDSSGRSNGGKANGSNETNTGKPSSNNGNAGKSSNAGATRTKHAQLGASTDGNGDEQAARNAVTRVKRAHIESTDGNGDEQSASTGVDGGNTATTTDAAGSGAETIEAAAVAPAAKVREKWIEPYGAIAGGLNVESIHDSTTDTAPQHPTVAISRMGLRGGVGEYVTFASSFEASMGGPMGYGASVWEGQAAIAIRDQYLRYRRAGWAVAVGRMDDPSSIDFVSKHIGDLLYADGYSRDPLLYAGADRGNGLFASYDITPNLTAGLTFHSTNPTGITGTLVIGGKLSVFDRPFYLAAAQVGRSSDNLPDQNLHIYFGTPSLRFHTEHFEANAAVQMYSLDTQVATDDDQTVRGYNLRLSLRGKFPVAVGELAPFLNASSNRNEILDATDSKYRLPDLYRSKVVSTGLDWDISKRGGVGFEYAMIDSQDPDQHTRLHYINLGGTWWVEKALAIGVRGAVVARQAAGAMETTGSRSLFVTARLVLE